MDTTHASNQGLHSRSLVVLILTTLFCLSPFSSASGDELDIKVSAGVFIPARDLDSGWDNGFYREISIGRKFFKDLLGVDAGYMAYSSENPGLSSDLYVSGINGFFYIELPLDIIQPYAGYGVYYNTAEFSTPGGDYDNSSFGSTFRLGLKRRFCSDMHFGLSYTYITIRAEDSVGNTIDAGGDAVSIEFGASF